MATTSSCARRALGAIGLVGLLGCEKVLDDVFRVDPCQDVGADSRVGAVWEIDGQGSREGCRESRYESDFRLHTPEPIPVAYSSDGVDAGDDRLPTRTVTGGATGFALRGIVRGRCVSFHTEEQVDGERVTYDFSGKVSGGLLSGEFHGSGPSSCTSRGTFTLR